MFEPKYVLWLLTTTHTDVVKMSSQRRRDEPTTQSFSLSRPNDFTKLDLKPRRFHFYNVLLFIFGTLFPPLGSRTLVTTRG